MRLALVLIALFFLAGLPAVTRAEDETPSVDLDPCTEYLNVRNATFAGTAAHDDSPIAAVEYRVDAGPWSPATAGDGQFGDQVTERYHFTTASLDDGWHTVDVKATTKAGYTTSPGDYATGAFCIDTVPPMVSLTPLSPDPWAGSTPTLVGRAEDSGSAVAAVEYRVDYVDWVAALALDGSFDSLAEDYSLTTAALPDGLHTVQCRAWDAAGNVSSPMADVFTLDATPPSLALEAVPAYVGCSTVIITGTATDAISTVASVRYSVDGGPWSEAMEADGIFDGSVEQYTLAPAELGDGSHTVAIGAADALGNTTADSDCLSSCFTVDTKPPVVSLGPPGSDPSGDNTPVFTGSVSDVTSPIVLVQYRIDAGDWQAAGAADGAFDQPDEDVTFTTAELTDAVHSVELKALDAAGNVSALVGHSFTIDITAPSISIDNIPDSVSQLSAATGTAADAPPGQIARVQVAFCRDSDGACWDGLAWSADMTWLDATGRAAWSCSMPLLTGGQSYSVRAVSVDTAGNLSSQADESFAVVMTDPTEADPSSTPDLPAPDGQTTSRSPAPPWWWFLGSGVGILALMVFILLGRSRRRRSST